MNFEEHNSDNVRVVPAFCLADFYYDEISALIFLTFQRMSAHRGKKALMSRRVRGVPWVELDSL